MIDIEAGGKHFVDDAFDEAQALRIDRRSTLVVAIQADRRRCVVNDSLVPVVPAGLAELGHDEAPIQEHLEHADAVFDAASALFLDDIDNVIINAIVVFLPGQRVAGVE